MKGSVQSFQEDYTSRRSDDFQLPKQWDYLSKRLTQVEKGLTIIEKKHHGLQKKFNLHAHDVTKFQVQLSEEIAQAKVNQLNADFVRQIASDSISQLKKDILQTNTNHFSRFESEINLNIFEIRDSIDSKAKNVFEQTKIYIDKVVFELKELLKKYVKEQTEMQIKLDRVNSLENSPCSLPKYQTVARNSKSSNKFFSNHQSCTNPSHQKSVISQKGSHQEISNQNSSTSRVNYLREKLKEFEKINKKYESEQVSSEKPENIMEKMKGYKNYLEQSQSELEPSNLFNHQSEHIIRKGFKR